MLNSVIYVNKCKIKSGVSGHQLASNLITVSGNSVIGGSFLLVVWLTVCWLTGVRVLEVVLPVPLRPVRLRLQRHQRHVHRLRAWDQAGKNGLTAGFSPCHSTSVFPWFKPVAFCVAGSSLLSLCVSVQAPGAADGCFPCRQWKLPARNMALTHEQPSKFHLILHIFSIKCYRW